MVNPAGDTQNWALMVDPGWQAAHPDEVPPSEAMVGGWPLDDEGNQGPFQPNPDYVPPDNVTPTDPTDAVLRLIARGADGVGGDELVSTLRDGMVEIAMVDRETPLVVVSPDDVRCVLVITAPAHRRRLEMRRWMVLPGASLVDVVPADLDVLLNPDGPAGFRLVSSMLRT